MVPEQACTPCKILGMRDQKETPNERISYLFVSLVYLRDCQTNVGLSQTMMVHELGTRQVGSQQRVTFDGQRRPSSSLPIPQIRAGTIIPWSLILLSLSMCLYANNTM